MFVVQHEAEMLVYQFSLLLALGAMLQYAEGGLGQRADMSNIICASSWHAYISFWLQVPLHQSIASRSSFG